MSIVLDGSTGITSSGPANVAAAVAAGDAVRLETVSLFPTVASAATTDFFGAVGATLNISGTTTVTGITACTAAQVGSIKTLIPSNAAGFSITATANIVVDGATSGTYLMPLNANIQIIATSTTTFKITTIFASGTWTPNGTGLTIVGTPTFSGTWEKTGRLVFFTGLINGATSITTPTNSTASTNLPFINSASGPAHFTEGATAALAQVRMYVQSGTLYSIASVSCGTTLYMSGTYSIQ